MPSRLGSTEPAREGIEPAREAGRGAGEDEGEPAVPADVEADRFGPELPNRGPPERIAKGRIDRCVSGRQTARPSEREGHVSNRRPDPVAQFEGQTPTMPLSPPVTSTHWNATAKRICAAASVIMAR